MSRAGACVRHRFLFKFRIVAGISLAYFDATAIAVFHSAKDPLSAKLIELNRDTVSDLDFHRIHCESVKLVG